MPSLQWIIAKLRFIGTLPRRGEAIYGLMARQYRERIMAEERARNPRLLIPYGYLAYSMGDEDGIQAEIFRRIGTTNRQFVEFGCGDGTENNTVYMLLLGWTGLWMDGSGPSVENACRIHRDRIASGALRVVHTFITRENINALLRSANLEAEPDLLVVDIDGNDYWIWEEIDCIRPRVVCVEYNGTFRPPFSVVQKYRADHTWDSTNYGGASLGALEDLGRQKGYSLVGCSFSGVNAFFVRNDLVGDHFAAPFTAEHHYREPMFDAFVRGYSRHQAGFGPYRLLPR